MSIITFWNNSREQSGRTLTSVAVAIKMAMERNCKILLLSTSVADQTIKNCFWENEKTKNTNLFNIKNSSIEIETGIEGLQKLVSSNKLEPSVITNYTKVVFKGRLEILEGPTGSKSRSLEGNIEDFKQMESFYIDLINTANKYYDIILVDLDKMLTTKTKEEILKISDVNVYVLSQKMQSINEFNELRDKNKDLMKNRCVPVIGKYINKFKYNSKNIARYLKEKKEFDILPLNLLYMQSAEEGTVVDLILNLRSIKDKKDENYIFNQSILNLTNNIFNKLQDVQMRMG